MAQGYSSKDFDRKLTRHAYGYKSNNEDLIGRKIIPVVSVGTKYTSYRIVEDDFDVYNLDIGNRGRPDSINNQGELIDVTLTNKSLMGEVDPDEQRESKDDMFDRYAEVTDLVMSRMEVKEEYDIAKVVFDSSNYLSANVHNLSSAYWSNESSDPIQVILDRLEDLPFGYGSSNKVSVVMGRKVKPKLIGHPKVVESVRSKNYANAGKEGRIMMDELNSVIPEVKFYVGLGQYGTLTKTANNLQDIWDRSVAIFISDPNTTGRSFGANMFAHYDLRSGPVVTTYKDFYMGPEAGTDVVKVTRRWKTIAVEGQKHSGILLQNVVPASI